MIPTKAARSAFLLKWVVLSSLGSLVWLLTPFTLVFWGYPLAILVSAPLSLVASLLAYLVSPSTVAASLGDVGQVLALAITLIATAGLFGAASGASQWLLLRVKVPKASLWIATSSLASALGCSLLVVLPLHLMSPNGAFLYETAGQKDARLVVGIGVVLVLSLLMFRSTEWWPKLAMLPLIFGGFANAALVMGVFDLPWAAVAIIIPFLAAALALPTGWLTTRWSRP